jgi:hypothetical protein
MRGAKDARTHQLVAACDVVRAARHRRYVCPVCGARVTYRSSMGLSPDPGFAHNKGEARPDCELYFQSFGVHLTSPYRPTASAEDAPEEIGMCVEDGQAWTTYLRLPEICGDVRLRALRHGSVEVEAPGVRNSISLMELRPGIGSARLIVPPAAVPYRVAPKGEWPVSSSRRNGRA